MRLEYYSIWYLQNYSKCNLNISHFHQLQLSRQDYKEREKIEPRQNMHNGFSYSMVFSNECLYNNNNRADTGASVGLVL